MMKAKEYLQQIPLWTKKKNTLTDIQDFLHELGDPESGFKIIHVAGTNGKGSVCADLTEILKTAGHRTGTFVSPHLVDVGERFLVDGEPAPEQDFEESFQKVYRVVRRMEAKRYCHPTYFEFCFLMAMELFARKGIAYCILETGLGGRLDATNSVRRPLLCVITSISLDHTQYLGNTITEIAGEKAGIIKEGVPVVYDDNEPEASLVIQLKSKEMHAPAYPVSEKDVPQDLPFAAPYQRMNAALAVRAALLAGIPGVDDRICLLGLKRVRWPGRMECAGPGIYLDGAHNPAGIRAFARAVKAGEETAGELRLLFAAVSDKDYGEMIHILCTEFPDAQVLTAGLKSGRTAAPGETAELFKQEGCRKTEEYSEVKSALDAALRRHQEGDRLYIVGSLYLLGEVRQYLQTGGTI